MCPFMDRMPRLQEVFALCASGTPDPADSGSCTRTMYLPMFASPRWPRVDSWIWVTLASRASVIRR